MPRAELGKLEILNTVEMLLKIINELSLDAKYTPYSACREIHNIKAPYEPSTVAPGSWRQHYSAHVSTVHGTEQGRGHPLTSSVGQDYRFIREKRSEYFQKRSEARSLPSSDWAAGLDSYSSR